ncbi:MAG TPA: aspartyl protease family protein [Acidimicrobiales bacterium]|nr:aspartyl protease family protein [Acidimicrobiales bacterium]
MDARRGLLVAALAAIGITVLALVFAALVSGPAAPRVRVEPEVNFALPSSAGGCGGAATTSGGATSVPITVSTVAGQVAESLNVCLAGKGPYPFVLDSGAGQSTIDAGLARRLHLAAAGPASQFAGVGCTGTARPVSSGSWSLDGVALAPQQLTAATLPQVGGKGEPVGLLGSDVLSRFGAVRIDFGAGRLVLPGPEGAPLAGTTPTRGPTGGPPPATLTGGQGTTVPATVTPIPGDVSVNVAVRFAGGARRDFVVDTGSSQSVVASQVAHTQALAGTNLAQRQATVCSVITVPLVHSGSWSVPGVALHPQLLGSTDFGAASLGGTQGLLGSDQLKRYGWVVLDYTGGRLVLGSP